MDVRILSATHKHLTQLVAQGRFREDLYYRINVIELRVPPLREHAEDIAELADAILHRLSKRTREFPPEISNAAREALQRYSFPGNVRELENILERALALSLSGAIDVEDLQLRLSVHATQAVTPAATGASSLSSSVPGGPSALSAVSSANPALGDQLDSIEREAIQRALVQTRYNKTAAAKLLGMSFRALRYRIKKLDIE